MKAMQCTPFHAENAKNDLKPTGFLNRNFYFEMEGVVMNKYWKNITSLDVDPEFDYFLLEIRKLSVQTSLSYNKGHNKVDHHDWSISKLFVSEVREFQVNTPKKVTRHFPMLSSF